MMINGLDVFAIGVVFSGGIIGAWRGFLRQMIAWSVWLWGLFFSWRYADQWLSVWPFAKWQASMNPWMFGFCSVLLIFIGLWLLSKLLQWLVIKIVFALSIRGLDRVLGFIVGVLQAIFALYLIVFFATSAEIFEDEELWRHAKIVMAMKKVSIKQLEDQVGHAKERFDETVLWATKRVATTVKS